MASSKTIIVTGDVELTRMLNALGRKVATRLHRTASRAAAKLILAHAKNTVPKKSGAFARSLTVRALKRSRKRMGYRVTQREAYASKGKSGGKEAFYGVFQELGWEAKGRGKSTRDIVRTRLGLPPKLTSNTTKPPEPRKIPGKWLVRKAGTDKEQQAIRLYETELRQFIEAEGT